MLRFSAEKTEQVNYEHRCKSNITVLKTSQPAFMVCNTINSWIAAKFHNAFAAMQAKLEMK